MPSGSTIGSASPAPGAVGRPGALRARVERAAQLRRRARRPADRRHPALRRAAQRRPPRASRPLPARLRRRRAARRARARPGSSGATRSTTGRRCVARATAGGSSGCDVRPSWPTSTASTTSAASSPTGRCLPARAAPARAAGGAGPGGAVFEAALRELGELPLIAEDLGVITPPVERLRLELGYPGHGRAACSASAAARTTRTAPRISRRAARRLHGHARHRDRGRLVGLAHARRRRPRPASTPPSRTGR